MGISLFVLNVTAVNSQWNEIWYTLIRHAWSWHLLQNLKQPSWMPVHILTFSYQESYTDLIKICHVLSCCLSKCIKFRFTGFLHNWDFVKLFSQKGLISFIKFPVSWNNVRFCNGSVWAAKLHYLVLISSAYNSML